MTKEQFWEELLPRLAFLPEEEQKRLTEYYSELLLDGLENGQREEEILAGFGNVDDIVRKVTEEYEASQLPASGSSIPYSDSFQPPKQRKWTGVWIATSILWVPLLIAAFILYIAGWIILLALAVCAVCMIPAGGALLFKGVVSLGTLLPGGLTHIGYGLVSCGLALLFGVATIILCKEYGRFSAWLFGYRKRKRAARETAEGRESQ